MTKKYEYTSMNFVDILIFNFLLQYEKIHFYVFRRGRL